MQSFRPSLCSLSKRVPDVHSTFATFLFPDLSSSLSLSVRQFLWQKRESPTSLALPTAFSPAFLAGNNLQLPLTQFACLQKLQPAVEPYLVSPLCLISKVIYTEAKVDVTQEIEPSAQWSAPAWAACCALCSISGVTSTLAPVYS